jgi:hypothetical protein
MTYDRRYIGWKQDPDTPARDVTPEELAESGRPYMTCRSRVVAPTGKTRGNLKAAEYASAGTSAGRTTTTSSRSRTR